VLIWAGAMTANEPLLALYALLLCTIAGALGAYGRRVKNRYKRSSFPFNQSWDHANGEMRHGMTPDVAEIILRLA